MRLTMKIAGFACLLAGFAATASATAAPEIDATAGTNALALLGGIALVIRSRRK